jgi:hypothetical protein
MSKVALLWRGNREARDTVQLKETRFKALGEAFGALGVEVHAAVYDEEFADEVQQQLLQMNGVLVWVNPLQNGVNRQKLDALLEQVATAGVFVSSRPDIILKLGTKEVLFQTRTMTWAAETYLYSSLEELRLELPKRLGTPRVLKQLRGNDGNGVWKVEAHPSQKGLLQVRHALRGSPVQDLTLNEFLSLLEPYFLGSGRIIDQAYQTRLTKGMVRCYLVQDKVVGFGHQLINALFPAENGTFPTPTERLYYPADKGEFQSIKQKMEQEWIEQLCQTLEIPRIDLPMIWDADFLFGEQENTFVLCEINVSSVYPFPDSALEPLAAATVRQLQKRT